MTDLIVYPASKPLFGRVPVPGDKSIVHRAILLAGLASGTSRIRGGALGDDNLSTLRALAAMGVRSSVTDASASTGPGSSADEDEPQGSARGAASQPPSGAASEIVIEGVGLNGLSPPREPIDCGNSGTTMRLLAGVLAAQRFHARLIGDASLSQRPMERVARPLRLRGAHIEGRLDPRKIGEITAPLDIGPLPSPHVLSALSYELPIPTAQVKSAILLSGLYADGPTYVSEPLVSRDHTERMLCALGVPVRSVGAMVELDAPSWSGVLQPFDITAPGDLSAATFLLAAAQITPGSRVDVRGVGLNPTRTGAIEILRDMGGAVTAEVKRDELGEPTGDLLAGAAELRAGRIGGELVARSIDEVPILCALGARARGTTVIADAQELRVKESDRLSAMAAVLRAFGVACEETPDGMLIEGRPDGALSAADIRSRGDHRIAMSAAVLGLIAGGPTRVRDADCIATSFPRFVGTLRALGARIDVVR